MIVATELNFWFKWGEPLGPPAITRCWPSIPVIIQDANEGLGSRNNRDLQGFMKRRSLPVGLFGVLIAVAGLPHHPFGGLPLMVEKAKAYDSGKAGRALSMPMARDPAAAVAEEYEAARRKATREALELFIARHGDDPLAEQARAELKRLPR